MVTAPLPVVADAAWEAPEPLPSPPLAGPEATPSARRRPPTVEFPTLDADDLAIAGESDQTFRDLPVASSSATLAADRPLPSIYSIVDRRHAPPAQAAPAVPVVTVHPSSSGAFSRRSLLDAEAVPEPIAPEMAPVARPEPRLVEAARHLAAPSMPAPRRAPAASYGPAAYAPAHALAAAHAPVEAVAPARRRAPAPAAAPAPRRAAPAARSARSRSGARPVASFSAAEAAFFAEGEELARAEWDAAVDDELDHVSLKRPGLWRRLTRRRRSG